MLLLPDQLSMEDGEVLADQVEKADQVVVVMAFLVVQPMDYLEDLEMLVVQEVYLVLLEEILEDKVEVEEMEVLEGMVEPGVSLEVPEIVVILEIMVLLVLEVELKDVLDVVEQPVVLELQMVKVLLVNHI